MNRYLFQNERHEVRESAIRRPLSAEEFVAMLAGTTEVGNGGIRRILAEMEVKEYASAQSSASR